MSRQSQATAGSDEVVSFDSEELVLVDEDDVEIGYLSKVACHRTKPVLHRAFSLFVFDADGRTLMQQRSASKPLWPLYWSNSCCSHPRRGEQMDEAIQRRLGEELGIDAPMNFLFKFRYQARFGHVGAEHEYCWVYAGRTSGVARANPTEVASLRWLGPNELSQELRSRPERYTPWLKLEWERIEREFPSLLRQK